MKILLRAFFLLTFLLGLLPLTDVLRTPDQPGFTVAVGVMLGCLICLAYWGIRSVAQPAWLEEQIRRMDSIFLMPGNMFWACFWLLGPVLMLLYGTLFTYLFLPPVLRVIFLWLIAVALLALLGLIFRYRSRVFWPGFWLPLAELPDGDRLDRRQRRVRAWLLTAGIIYFLLFGIVNAMGPASLEAAAPGSDEVLSVYPFVTGMLLPADSGERWAYHFFVDPAAPYGFPFYLISALMLVPMRLAGGAGYAEYVQLNLLFLRQLLSVLPLLLSAAVLVYMHTHFHARYQALATFAVILLAPQAIAFSTQTWRPEGLMLLLVVLVLFLLVKDNLSFGINFRVAAVLSSIAAAAQFYGVLLILLFVGLLVAGMRRHALTMRQAGALFAQILGIAVVTVALANPFLFIPSERDAVVDAVQRQTDFTTPGLFSGKSMMASNPGLGAHLQYLEERFGSNVFLLFLLVSITAEAVWGNRQLAARLILGWFVILSVYLVFVSPRAPGNAWMVAVLPLFSGALALANFIKKVPARRVRRLLEIAIVLILVAQGITQLTLGGLHLTQTVGLALGLP